MAKEKFRDSLHLNKKNMERLIVINDIIEEYAQQGYKLTLRQLYYQLVSRDIVPNRQEEYAKLSILLVKGRMGGAVDWESIEDRIRIPFLPYWVIDIQDAINDTAEQYRLDRQKGQSVYIELWVEKDALSGVLRKITSYYHINLMVNRGYSSCSAMHDGYERFLQAEEGGKTSHILYLGDHDASGLDMIRDIKERLEEFGIEINVTHIALTNQQIVEYNPPPNPAKMTDPRANWYIQKHGNESWEVDALKPEVLHQLVKENVENLIDMDLFTNILEKEKKDKKILEKFAKNIEGDSGGKR